MTLPFPLYLSSQLSVYFRPEKTTRPKSTSPWQLWSTRPQPALDGTTSSAAFDSLR